MNQAGPEFVRIPVRALGQNHLVAANIYMPQNKRPERMVFCFPGGTYSKSYYDVPAKNGQTYSLSRWLLGEGNVVICVDHLGVGDSTKPADGAELTRNVLADAGALAVEYLTAHLRAGTVIAEWPPMGHIPRIGVGHSLGGLVLLALQARHKAFDAIAVLGWSNQSNSVSHDISAPESYVIVDREALRPFFHLNDVPQDIILADDLRAERVPAGILVEGQRDRISMADAQTVSVPVFICFGELDLCPNPQLEPSTYPNSNDVTMFRLLGSAHNHNFASSRLQFFRRLSSWIAVGFPAAGI